MGERIAKTVGEYISMQPREVRAALENLRKTIKAAAPKAEEKISWSMPAYKENGFVVFFAAFKNHLSLFAIDKSLMSKFKRELEPFDTSGTTIHFTADHPLPASLVRKIVKARVARNKSDAKKERKG